MVKALPDEEALDVAASRQPVFIHVDPEQTTVGLIVNPFLIVVRKTCTTEKLSPSDHSV